MMLGASVREEILFRFCALNLFTWLAMKILRQPQPTTAIVWPANILVALLFAWLHLVPAAQLLDSNAIATGTAIALATLAGAVFGWVYWQHGLTMAIFTHAIAGLVVYLGTRGLIAFAP
jgi:membrane protease YdiL (CAAX protease family)